MRIHILNCPHCGNVPISGAEYARQMNRADRGWHCPLCFESASYKHCFTPCMDAVCKGWIDMEAGDEVCPVCKRNQYELYMERQNVRS